MILKVCKKKVNWKVYYTKYFKPITMSQKKKFDKKTHMKQSYNTFLNLILM